MPDCPRPLLKAPRPLPFDMRRSTLLGLIGLCTVACSTDTATTDSATATNAANATPAASADTLPHDVHSFAQPEKARVTHVSLDLIPDFATKRIAGIARLAIERTGNADSVVLDIRDLTIRRVSLAGGDTL